MSRSSIHSIIIKRLFFSWLLTSVLLGGLATHISSLRNEERLLSLATGEAEKLSQRLNGSIRPNSNSIDTEFVDKFRQIVASNLVMGELFSASGHRIIEAVGDNTDPALLNELRSHAALQLREQLDYKRRKIGGQPMVVFMLPMKDKTGQIVTYFKGAFAIDKATILTLKNDLVLTVAIVLAAVLANSLILYPVILSLNRDTISFSRRVLKGNAELMAVLGSAIAKRDSDTSNHNYRVTLYAVALAQAAKLSSDLIRALIAGAFLHDVGKIGISDSILLKPARLTPKEFEIMKTHVSIGGDILKNSSWLAIAQDVVVFHHEKYDGSGYIQGLKGSEIPVTARIFAIVDVFDALTSERPYKMALPLTRALEIIKQDAGSHFDPQLVSMFTGIAKDLFDNVTASSATAMESRLQNLLDQYFTAKNIRFPL